VAVDPIRKDVQILPEPCSQREQMQNWKKTRQHISDLKNDVEDLEEEINELVINVGDIGDIIIQIQLDITEIVTGYAGVPEWTIYFELLEHLYDGEASATVLSWYNGPDPGSPVTVHDPLGRFKYARTGALGRAIALWSGGVVAMWIVVECQQLVKLATATTVDSSCGGGDIANLQIENFESIPEGEYVQEPDPIPTEVANPFGYAGPAGSFVKLERWDLQWTIVNFELNEIDGIVTTVYLSGMTVYYAVGSIPGYGCSPGGTESFEVFTASPCS
jgi:hypothetical protein